MILLVKKMLERISRLFFVSLILILYMFLQVYAVSSNEVVAIKLLHSLVAGIIFFLMMNLNYPLKRCLEKGQE